MSNNGTVVELTLTGATLAQVEGLHREISKLIGSNSLGVAPGYPAKIRQRDDLTRLEIEKGYLRAFLLARPDGSFVYELPSDDSSNGVSVSVIETVFENGLRIVRITGTNLDRVDGARLADPIPGVTVSYGDVMASAFEVRLTDWRFLNHPPYPAETRSRLILTVQGDAIFTTEQIIYHQEPN
jgi:hypothetical protein